MRNLTRRMPDFLRQQPRAVAVAAFVAGLVIGLPVLGWGLWPVQWEKPSFADLRPAGQQQYVRLVAASYALDLNSDQAAERIQALGPQARQVISDTLSASQGDDAMRVAQLRQGLGVTRAVG